MPFSKIFLSSDSKKVKFQVMFVPDATDGVKRLRLTESFRKCCALVSLTNFLTVKAL